MEMKTGCDCYKQSELDKNVVSDSPRKICYCNNITEQEIRAAVKETGFQTINEIKNHLREKLVSNCAELNPTGECCHRTFNYVIQEALKE